MYILIGLVLATIFLRALPGVLRIQPESSDQTYHLLVAERIRRNKFKYPKRLEGFALPGYYDYPPLFHYFLALFPRKKREQLCPFFSAAVDTVHMVVIYLFVLVIAQMPEFAGLVLNPRLVASIAALMFCISPSLLYYGIGPRAFNTTPRPLGEFFVTITLFLCGFFYLHGEVWTFLLAGIFAGVVFLTSKFSGQALLFFSVILGFLLRSLFFFVLPALGLAFAFILSKGHYWGVLRGWVKHSALYRKIIAKRSHLLKHRNDFSEFKTFFSKAKKRDLAGAARSLLKILQNNTYVILLTRNVMIFAVFFLVFKYWGIILANNVLCLLLSWIIASLGVFFLTSLRSFFFLGEAERYLEHSVPAQSFIFSVLIFLEDHGTLFAVIIAYSIFFYLGTVIQLYLAYRVTRPRRKAKEELLNWFVYQKIVGKKVLTIPYEIHYDIPYRTHNEILYPPANFTLMTEEEFKDLHEVYPYPSTNLLKLVDRYNLDLIVTNNEKLKEAREEGWRYDLSQFEPLFRNNFYSVYRTR